MKIKKIGIVGLGLIGGSLALKLLIEGYDVSAYDPNLKSNSVRLDSSKLVLNENLKFLDTCDLVFICVPLRHIVESIEEIQPYLKSGSIITDVGSVKSFVCDKVKEIFKRNDCCFVGGHPMAGTEKSGFENSFPELFEGKTWVLMSENEELKSVIEKTGAKVLITSAEKHDKAAALISHLPLLLSIGLLKTLENLSDQELKTLAMQMASTGFNGMIRLAKGNSVLNTDLLSLNKLNLKEAYERFLKEIWAVQDSNL